MSNCLPVRDLISSYVFGPMLEADNSDFSPGHPLKEFEAIYWTW